MCPGGCWLRKRNVTTQREPSVRPSSKSGAKNKSILVAVDGSAHAKAAVEYGARLAVKLGARVELRHVVERRLSQIPALRHRRLPRRTAHRNFSTPRRAQSLRLTCSS
ncbi:MAG: universal stress protein [Blastocatellia bacterium]